METLKFIFAHWQLSFGYLLGLILVFAVIMYYINFTLNNFLRHRRIMKHGWPPSNCDGDGDSYEDNEQ